MLFVNYYYTIDPKSECLFYKCQTFSSGADIMVKTAIFDSIETNSGKFFARSVLNLVTEFTTWTS